VRRSAACARWWQCSSGVVSSVVALKPSNGLQAESSGRGYFAKKRARQPRQRYGLKPNVRAMPSKSPRECERRTSLRPQDVQFGTLCCAVALCDREVVTTGVLLVVVTASVLGAPRP